MNRKNILILLIPFLAILLLTSCEPLNEAKFTVNNLAAETVYLNFRGELYPIEPNEKVDFTSIPIGAYQYETIFDLPAGVTNFTAEGAVTGEVQMKGGTQCLLVYTSSFIDGSYTIFGSLTTSDQANRPDPWDREPLFP